MECVVQTDDGCMVTVMRYLCYKECEDYQEQSFWQDDVFRKQFCNNKKTFTWLNQFLVISFVYVNTWTMAKICDNIWKQ
jgi:hypothetical protein